MHPTPRCTRALLCAVLISLIVPLAPAHEAAADMMAAANKFLAGLDAAQRKQATYALTDAERENWNFVPIARNGVPFKQMTPAQIDLAKALIRTGVGQAGVKRAEAIITMENVLKELENDTIGRRDPTNYFITIFGTPAEKDNWGWRFEGHHLSFNFTVVDGSHVFFAPSFLGSNPAEVRAGPRQGERILGEEEDLGHALMISLDEAQRKVAVFNTRAPNEILTTNQKRVQPLEPSGLPAAQMTPAQREKLIALVKLYLARFRAELAEEEFAEITRAGIDQITLAWAGAIGRTQGVGTYYRIQGPTFLIEFDNTQNQANHIHTTFRDFKGDFGHDLLAEHYAKEHAKK